MDYMMALKENQIRCLHYTLKGKFKNEMYSKLSFVSVFHANMLIQETSQHRDWVRRTFTVHFIYFYIVYICCYMHVFLF